MSKLLTQDQISAFHDKWSGKINMKAFCARYGCTPEDAAAEVERLLLGAQSFHDGDAVEYAFFLGFHFGFPTNIMDLIHGLLGETWHIVHEDMISLLQDFRNPSSVPYLQAAISLKPKLEYLDSDDFGAYYKKCLWALTDIGTPEAFVVINECSHARDPELAEQARYRLKRIASNANKEE